ncbi:MAG: cation:proton antiporter [Anaerotruncus sp.]|nr:cation:proton antiporter [Anaerotruncus sp.]
MTSYHYLFDVAAILLATKFFGIVTKKFAMPQVVGALVAGLLLGPACFGVVRETEFINQISELGVIVLMFTAGLETDIVELRRSGKAAIVIAACGVLLPLAGGALLASFYNTGSKALLENIFVGVVLTATSVSITVEALKEMGKISTRSGNAILGAALADDVLGIVALTIITSVADPNVKLWLVLVKIAAFFALSLVVGIYGHRLFQRWMAHYERERRRFAIISFAFCLLLAYVAEAWFGVADITGAFIAGLILSNTTRVTYVANRFDILSYMLLSPLFFANVGLKVELPKMTGSILSFTILLTLIGILSKVVGCGLGARLCHYDWQDSLRIGVGMISRGEVALIVASKGVASGLMNPQFFAPIIIMVVMTTVLAPILLKPVYREQTDYSDMQFSPLADQYEEIKNFDLASQVIVEISDRARTKKHREKT